MPQLGQVHIDSALTNLSIQYKNMQYVAEQVFPILPVAKRSDKYYVYNQGMMVSGTALDSNGKPLSLRRPKTRASELDFALSNQSYYCDEYALAELVSDAEVAYADMPLQPDIDATEFLTNRIALDNEIQVANIACKSTNYETANKTLLVTGSGTNVGDCSWKSYSQANSDPFTNLSNGILAIIASGFQEPTNLALTITTAQVLSQHPAYRDRYKYVNQDGLTKRRLVHPMVEGMDTIECKAQKATNNDGATLATGNVWVDENGTNIALLFYKSEMVGPKSLHFGRTFEAPDDTTGARGWSVRRWRDEPRKGSMIEVSTLRDYELVAIDSSSKSVLGYLISGCTL